MAEEFKGAYRATLVEHEEDYYTQAQITVYDAKGSELFKMDCAVSPEKGVD